MVISRSPTAWLLAKHVEVAELEAPALGDAAHEPFEGVLGGGDGSVVLGFGLPSGFQGRDDRFLFMDVEAYVECLRCACVRFHSFVRLMLDRSLVPRALEIAHDMNQAHRLPLNNQVIRNASPGSAGSHRVCAKELMRSPWIENYRGQWENREGFGVKIELSSDGTVIVDVIVDGRLLDRPWCTDMPAESLPATNREDEGLGVEVHLGRDGFSLFLNYESAGQFDEKECIIPAVSRLLEDQEAEQWTSLFSAEALYRKG